MMRMALSTQKLLSGYDDNALRRNDGHWSTRWDNQDRYWGVRITEREAVVIASDQNRHDAANAVIEVSEKIKRDIASLFLAEDRDIALPSIPFSKDFIIEQLKLITMMLAHVSLAEIEHNGFQSERLPQDVRLKKEPFKMERDVPDYMEGAFDHRLKLEKDFKKDMRQAQKEEPEESP